MRDDTTDIIPKALDKLVVKAAEAVVPVPSWEATVNVFSSSNDGSLLEDSSIDDSHDSSLMVRLMALQSYPLSMNLKKYNGERADNQNTHRTVTTKTIVSAAHTTADRVDTPKNTAN